MRAVEQVLLDYFDGVDRRDPEAAVSVFAADARAEIMTGKVLEGRDRIGRALGRVLVRYARTSHHPTNARVEIDGDRATLRTYVYAYHRMTTGDVWHLWARLYDGMERRDGRWLIVDHRLTGVDSEPHRPDIGADWYGGHPGHLAPGPIPDAQRWPGRRLPTPCRSAGAGLALVRGAASGDGALPAGTKALFAAAAAAAKGHAGQLRDGPARSEGRGRSGGARLGRRGRARSLPRRGGGGPARGGDPRPLRPPTEAGTGGGIRPRGGPRVLSRLLRRRDPRAGGAARGAAAPVFRAMPCCTAGSARRLRSSRSSSSSCSAPSTRRSTRRPSSRSTHGLRARRPGDRCGARRCDRLRDPGRRHRRLGGEPPALLAGA